MLDVLVWIAIIIFSSAFLGSLIGLGGGFLMVPLLSVLLGIPIHEAIGLSLISIVGVSTSASLNYVVEGNVDFKLGSILEVASVLGAIAGANIALYTPSKILCIVFGSTLVYIGLVMFRGGSREKIERLPRIGRLKMLNGFAASFIAGLLSGLLGIGGGILKVPIMTLYLDVPMKIAIGTSEYMIAITSFTGSFIYLNAGKINIQYLGSAFLASVLGAQLGSKVSLRTEAYILRKIFAIVMMLFAFIMVLKGVSM